MHKTLNLLTELLNSIVFLLGTALENLECGRLEHILRDSLNRGLETLVT